MASFATGEVPGSFGPPNAFPGKTEVCICEPKPGSSFGAA